MTEKTNTILKKIPFLVLAWCAAGILTACAQNNTIENKDPEHVEETPGGDMADDVSGNRTELFSTEKTPTAENTVSEKDTSKKDDSKDTGEDDLKKMFGENCITGQTFEAELSEYSGTVFFVPFAPSQENPDFHIQLIRDGEILTEIPAYVPDSLTGETFRSLDAVSFFDLNYDGYTDIVLIETYGDTSFAAVYYGFHADADDFENSFVLEQELSENISDRVKPLSIPEIRSALSDGKKNGTFTDYKEAYKAVSRLCGMQSTSEQKYDLIYFDEDEIPELVCGVDGYYTSLYAYHDGTVYTLMDRWAYGAMGNAGYEYSPGKNSLRNYNSDFAGAIVYTTYMAIDTQRCLDTVVQIETFNFDDVNGNGIPDEGEEESVGRYGINYINGTEASDAECAAYNAGEYEYITGIMNLEELNAKLK